MQAIIWFNVFTVTTLYAQQTSKSGADLSSRIWYGERANIKDYPFYASLGNCGSVILSEWWLATAAHCVVGNQLNKTGQKVRVGEDGVLTSQPYTFNEVIVYPFYWFIYDIYPMNDIALLKLTRPLTFGSNVKPIRLPSGKGRGHQRNAIYAVAGRGKDETNKRSEHLMAIKVRSLGEEECLYYWPSMDRFRLYPFLGLIKTVTICTTRIEDKPGVCYGDSGSPLVQGNTLVGIASYINVENCSEARLGMYTDVAPFVGWIKWVTGIR